MLLPKPHWYVALQEFADVKYGIELTDKALVNALVLKHGLNGF